MIATNIQLNKDVLAQVQLSIDALFQVVVLPVKPDAAL
jgi:hypothetical protein